MRSDVSFTEFSGKRLMKVNATKAIKPSIKKSTAAPRSARKLAQTVTNEVRFW